MPKIQLSVEINGSPERIWGIIIDPSLAPKMIPDVISATTDRSGGVVEIGCVWTLVAKIVRRKVKLVTEAIEVVPYQKLVIKITPGGIFKTFVSRFELEPTKKGTTVMEKVEYSTDNLGGSLSALLVNRHTKRNIIQGLSNLKELVELQELED